MAFSYNDLTRIKNNIITDTESINALFNEFSALIDESVNNDQIWRGASAYDFKTTWDSFALEKFPEYKNIFNKEINNVVAAINAYQRAEGN